LPAVPPFGINGLLYSGQRPILWQQLKLECDVISQYESLKQLQRDARTNPVRLHSTASTLKYLDDMIDILYLGYFFSRLQLLICVCVCTLTISTTPEFGR
jgi:hypothetical protein